MTLSCGRVGPFMSSFWLRCFFDAGHCGGGGGGGGGGGREKHLRACREDAWWLGKSQVRFLVAERRFLRIPAKCGFW